MYIKANSVKRAASSINELIDDTDYQDQINELTKSNDFCVLVFANDDEMPVFSSNSTNARCGLSEFSIRNNMTMIDDLREEAKQNNGSASKLLDDDSDMLKDKPQNEGSNEKEVPNEYAQKVPIEKTIDKPFAFLHNNEDNTRFDKERIIKSMTYISVLTGNEGDMKTIIVNAQLTPVNATIDTIKTQFLIFSSIFIIIALLVALYLSKKIASPIIHINATAKQLATGDYDVAFQGSGYLEIKELNDTLNYAAKELSKVENLRKELIANMSHDLRTPLTMIAGYGEVMRDIPGENTAENVQIIIDETLRLTSLVNDMLDLSKLQAGVQELTIEKFSLTQEIQDIIARYDKMFHTKDILLIFDQTQDVSIEGDPVKLDQVIYNLINNAINYCGDDNQVIICQTIIKNIVKVEIIDHGPGIDEEQLPYIWERYYKVDKTHVRSKVGSGLGLSIVRTVLEMHKAEYGVESTVGEGTTFWFTLPII